MLTICIYPANILSLKAREVQAIDAEIPLLVALMEKTMQANNGIGLAAPQVGISKRVIVVKDGKENHAFLNPRIIEQSKERDLDEEGCLSLPGLFAPVKRAKNVKVLALTLQGDQVTIAASGLAARIFQHEIDHLQGILITQRIGFWKRWKLRKLLEAIKKTHANE